MSKIPEVIDLDTQTERLMQTFGDNDDFEKVRGKCGGQFMSVTDGLMQTKNDVTKAPSAGVADLKRFLTSFANIRNKIAQLERDGFAVAVGEACEALKNPDYRMLGEIHPFSNTTPVTLVIFNPEMTLAILKKAQPGGVHESWRAWYQSDLPQDFPPVQKHIFFYTDVLETLTTLNKPMLEKAKQRITQKSTKHVDLFESIVIPHNRRTQAIKRVPSTFAFAFYAKKENVLKCFPHEEQAMIAAWQFNLPKIGTKRTLAFGLHLQAERDYWQRKRAPLCSMNIACGHGAIAYPGEAYHCFDKKSERFKGTRILLSN